MQKQKYDQFSVTHCPNYSPTTTHNTAKRLMQDVPKKTEVVYSTFLNYSAPKLMRNERKQRKEFEKRCKKGDWEGRARLRSLSHLFYQKLIQFSMLSFCL